MGFPDFKKDLENSEVDVNHILDKYFHTGPSAVFAGAPPGEEAKLKATVASTLFEKFKVRVHPVQLVICGSAHLGFSPVAEKLGQPFNSKTSDIDIAVASPELFELCWTELQSAGLDEDTRSLVSRDLFWGFINPANIQNIQSFGSGWWQAFGQLKTDRAHGVRGRLYKNFWSMHSYHRITVLGGRKKCVMSKGTA